MLTYKDIFGVDRELVNRALYLYIRHRNKDDILVKMAGDNLLIYAKESGILLLNLLRR